MNRIIINSINRCCSNKSINNISHIDIWENASDGIYEYYDSLDTFIKNFDLQELSSLYEFHCNICNKTIYLIQNRYKNPICQECKTNKQVAHSWYNMDPNSKEYKSGYENLLNGLPQCHDVNSNEYKIWKDNLVSSLPQCHDVNSNEYQSYYKKLIDNNPACMDKNSEEYLDWYMKVTQANPACMDKNSEEYLDWYNSVISNLPQCQSKDSNSYENWITKNPSTNDSNSTAYITWYNNNINAMPQCQAADSNEYKKWKSSLPQCNVDPVAYQHWKDSNSIALQRTNNNKKWSPRSASEVRLSNLRLSYVLENNVGQDSVIYTSDDGCLRHFYPDFKIQIGYGSESNADWEFIEYKGDHLLSGVFDDQAQTHNKYKQCRYKVGFVPDSLTWLFELCIMNPEADKLFPNPRVLAYVIYDIWDNKCNCFSEANLGGDFNSIFTLISKKYSEYR